MIRSVHPHVCGERMYCPKNILNVIGSSPRVWGTFFLYASKHFGQRFIPTCVGNVLVLDPASDVPAVHPHVCGERIATKCGKIFIDGSSPRVWGTCCPFKNQ